MKRILTLFLALCLSLPAIANEGMWLPILLNRNYEEMKEMGLQLTPEELYSVNQSSLKDAIVSFGGFCTGEIISPNGLILTNHHCGFSAIQSHSTKENNLLDNGFWARSYQEEKPTEDLFVRFLVRIEDVTQRVLADMNDSFTEDQRDSVIAVVSREISTQSAEDEGYEAEVKSFFHGNEFYLFVYEKFTDVRFVGAPPSSIGKYGGDTDNWMWPRHTGDFSLFRVYTGPDGKPAPYAEENIPLSPKHYLPISLEGVKEGDFAMVFGYPGSTDRFLSSYGVEQAIEKYNPTVVEIRDRKLDIMKEAMNADDQVRLDYASKYARTSNYWKYYIGQTEQLKQNKVYDAKKEIENNFSKWVMSDPLRRKKFGETLKLLESGYKSTDDYVKGKVYVLEAGLLGSDLALFGFQFDRYASRYLELENLMEEKIKEADTQAEKEAVKEKHQAQIDGILAALGEEVNEHFKGYNKELDKKMFAELLQMYYDNVPAEQQPEFFAMVRDKYDGDFQEFADKVYDKTMLVSKEEIKDFLEDPREKTLRKDLGIMVGSQLYDVYRASATANKDAEDKLERGYRLLTAGLREMDSEINYAPDANSTLRMTYGSVGSYYPRDGVFYDYYTTHKGILQKADPNDPEFIVPEKLKELLQEENFGRYADENGDLPVCFISNNDITGGNSGSPVINGKGELIGCAFDGNWEAMSGDIFFEDDLQRTISVDARYMVFIIDKYAGAQNILNELTLVQNEEGPGFDPEAPESAEETSSVAE